MKKILSKFVLESYQNISEEFFHTRRNLLWKEFEDLKLYLKEGIKILDLGCGGGRIIKFLEKHINKFGYKGVDFSENLIKLAKKEFPNYEFYKLDITNPLPFKKNYFDIVLLIAVLHHIPSKESRFFILKEVKRVLKPEGILFITNWNLIKPKLFLRYFFSFRRLKILKFTFFSKHLFIPWAKKSLRYYYAFSLKELENLCKKVGFKILKIYKNKNLVVICKKRL